MSERVEPFEQKIKFWYSKLPLTGNILWPIVKIDISFGKLKLPQPTLALIDSGASSSLLHPDLADFFKVSADQKGNILSGTTVSGNYDYWHPKKDFAVTVENHPFIVRFDIPNNKDLIWPCILGQDSLFNMAKIEFRGFKKQFSLSFRTDVN